VEIMETTSSGNVGRSNLPCESASQRAARETDPTVVDFCAIQPQMTFDPITVVKFDPITAVAFDLCPARLNYLHPSWSTPTFDQTRRPQTWTTPTLDASHVTHVSIYRSARL